MPSHSWQRCPAWTHRCCQPSIAVSKIQKAPAAQPSALSIQTMFQLHWSLRNTHTIMREGVDEVMGEAASVFLHKATAFTDSSPQHHGTFEVHARKSHTSLFDNDPSLTTMHSGLNTAANHGFLARDGITTFAELVDAQQNIYNVGYDLSLLLAFLGLQADGDLITTKLSIGCEATSRTSINPLLTGSQPGLAGHSTYLYHVQITCH